MMLMMTANIDAKTMEIPITMPGHSAYMMPGHSAYDARPQCLYDAGPPIAHMMTYADDLCR
ncbi:hypothetical protein, variant [Blastomyces dermatitidis ER-3]|uniref:Uncharacterized protein n=1 Tax=Ajellomyces dermatitidis (strain ER-3 / ATCC MYA-2586) TaxID=559297 RepID=A0ABX2VTN8_AJEDR|nr:hypothetical protein, variant [Blastomyces dermatitidis ER-3]OAT00548.1 hypothetical protein, variant [Blastomyces dermatitidis ER-3]